VFGEPEGQPIYQEPKNSNSLGRPCLLDRLSVTAARF